MLAASGRGPRADGGAADHHACSAAAGCWVSARLRWQHSTSLFFDLAAQLPSVGLVAARRNSSAPVTCNATLVDRDPDEVVEDAHRWPIRASTPSGSSSGADNLATVRAVRERSAQRCACGSTPTAPGPRRRCHADRAALEPSGVELVGVLRRAVRAGGVRFGSPIPIVGPTKDVAPADDATQAVNVKALRCDHDELSKVAASPPRARIAEILPAELHVERLDGPLAGSRAAAHLALALADAVRPPGSPPGCAF